MDLNLSPQDALKMFEDQGREDTPADEPQAEPTPEQIPVAEAKEAPAEPEQKQEVREPEGIATKDGKHVIPYSVLQSERTRAAQADRELQEARTRIAALEASLTEPKPTAKPGDNADTVAHEQDDERLAQLAEDFPTVAAELKAMRELVKSMEKQLKPLQETTDQEQARRANEVAMTVQEAIDSVPKMAHIQAANPEAFELAKQFDLTLRERADWAGKPMSERFAKVVELVESSLGEIAIPGQKAPSADPAALKKAATEKLQTAAKAVPTSLSQFPAGDPVAADEVAAIEQMSTAQLASKIGKMTPSQLEAFYASL